MNKKDNTTPAVSKLDTVGRSGLISLHVTQSTGGKGLVVRALQPSGPGAAIFGGKTITFQKELWGFSFDVVRGYCMVHAGEC